MKYFYKLKNGQVVGHVDRIESASSSDQTKRTKKTIPYFVNGGNDAGLPDDLPATHYWYGMETVLDVNKPVYLVEGEKCAHALQTLGFQCVTTVGGCGRINKIDFSPLEGIKHIVLLPDNDESGEKYMQVAHYRLSKLQSKPQVKVVRLPDLPEKGDVCDYLACLPELSAWDQLESLKEHFEKEVVCENLNGAFEKYLEVVPAEWTFKVSKSKHKLITSNNLLRMNIKKRSVLLTPWLAEGSINMVFADRGIGKTFFCLSCAVAVANGESFLGFKASEAVPVLYLDGEMQASAMQERLSQLTEGKLTKADLSIYTPDCQDLTDHIPDIGTPKGREEINELINLVDPKVIFLDNISTFVRTGSENEGDSWAPVQEWAVQMRKQGRALVFVHHANKEGKQRGSHKKEDVMDLVMQLCRPDDYLQGMDATRICVRYTKARHLNAEETQEIEATLKDVDGKLQWSWQAGDLTFQRAVEMIKCGDMSMSEIADEFGVSKSTIHRWKQRAIKENNIN